MTDHFEEAKDAILKSARANGGITIDHLFDAIVATNDDLDEKLEEQRLEAVEKHAETKAWHDEIATMVAEHITEASERDRRITNLEIEFEDRRSNCIPEVKRLIHEEHEVRHTNYLIGLEPDQRSFAQILAGWTLLKKGVAIAVTALIIGLVGLGVTYFGSLLAADRAEQNGIQIEKTALPTPTVTVTVTPSP